MPDNFIRDADMASAPAGAAGLTVKRQLADDRMAMAMYTSAEGSAAPRQQRDDRTTIGCVVRGRLELGIGGQSFTAGPGDAWQVPRGVSYDYRALEDSTHMEITSGAEPGAGGADPGRIVPAMAALFRRDADVEMEQIRKVEGGTNGQFPSLKLMMATPEMHCLKIYRRKGALASYHTHMEHSTVCCLLEGKVRLWIGDETFVAEPGDVWLHPPGVPHQTEAIEASVQIEAKSPACKTW